MKTPKFRSGHDHSAEVKSRVLDAIDVPYLRSRKGDSEVKKKDGFLEVRTGGGTPFLWALVATPESTKNKPFGYRLTARVGTESSRTQQTDRIGVSGASDGQYPTQVFVGDNYVLRMSTSPASGACWPSLVYLGSKATEVLSLSAGNVPKANVSFADVAQFLFPNLTEDATAAYMALRPSIVATGWDSSAKAYSFAIFGRNESQTNQFLCYVGNTASRRLTPIDVVPAAFGYYRLARCACVGKGKLLAAVLPLADLNVPSPVVGSNPNRVSSFEYPDVPALLRSDDHGRTWFSEPAPWLQPYLMIYFSYYDGKNMYADLDDRALPFDVCAPQNFVATPVGEGRIACVVMCGAGPPGTVVSTSAPAWQNRNSAYRFFLSDNTGKNFVNVPWPADAWYGADTPFAVPPAGYQFLPRVGADLGSGSLQNAPLSAGPGSFFMSVCEYIGNDKTKSSVKVLSTRDYGATWVLSPALPTDATNVTADYVQIMNFAVARAVKDGHDGEIYCMSIRDGKTVRVYKTSDYFKTFKLVGKTKIPGLLANLSILRIHPVYTGAAGTDYPPLIHPGFPKEFEKPV